MNPLISEIQKKLSELLPKKRYEHSLGVAYLAASIAMCYKQDIEKAMLAGLLHDCAKYLSKEEILKQCERYHIPISEVEYRDPSLLHGKLGAYFAEHTYHIKSKEVLSAITYHTTGKPDMDFLEKAIFLADYLEPNRKQPTTPPLNEIRALLFQDLDKTTYLVLKNTVNYLMNRQGEIDKVTIKTLEYYKQLV